MPDARDTLREHLKGVAQGILDMEAQRGRIPDENLRSVLEEVARTGEVPPTDDQVLLARHGQITVSVRDEARPEVVHTATARPRPRNILMRLKDDAE